MATAKSPNLSDLLQLVASACISSPCHGNHLTLSHRIPHSPDHDQNHQAEETDGAHEPPQENHGSSPGPCDGAAAEVEALMEEVFEAVGAVKRAYVRLQEAHCPWDAERMRTADEAVLAELRRLGRLKERFRRGRTRAHAALPLADAVAPYVAALEDARREAREKELELQGLKERIGCVAVAPVRKGRRRLSPPSPSIPTPELFESCFSEVKSASSSFARRLLSLIRRSGKDVASAIRRSIVNIDLVGPHHAKHALTAHLHRKLFQGFEDESFYMEGSLSSLLRPAQHRSDCYVQFRDFRSIDPAALLGVLPGCAFGRWAGKVYLSIVTTEVESLLSDDGELAEQRRVVEGGGHPRTGFHGEYLRMAKAVWMLHLLAFALESPPSLFEAAQGSEYEAEHMESVVGFPAGVVPAGWTVGLAVAPGFKLGNGTMVRAQVYLVRVGPL